MEDNTAVVVWKGKGNFGQLHRFVILEGDRDSLSKKERFA